MPPFFIVGCYQINQKMAGIPNCCRVFQNCIKCLIANIIFSSESRIESVNGHFWSNLCLKCNFNSSGPDLSKHTFGQLSTVPGFDSRSRQHYFFSFFPHFPLFFDSVPLLFHSNFQSWQMRSLPTSDPYVFLGIHFSDFFVNVSDFPKKNLKMDMRGFFLEFFKHSVLKS